MKRNNNRYENKHQINTNKSTNVFNPYINKTYKNFSMTSSSLSNSIEGKFNTINNIRDSKVVKIKTITKKNENPKYNIKQNTNKKEKDSSEDSSSDYANAEDDDFNNILKESISMQSINKSKKEENPFLNKKNIEKITYDKLNEHFLNNDEYINKYPSKIKTKEENNNKAYDNLLFMNPYTDTNKSLNMENINIPEKNDININNTPTSNEEYNLLKNNNIFNNNNNIIYLPKENKDESEKEKEKDILENSELKARLINHNKYISKKLKEIKFLEKLKSISDSRYLFFIKNFRKENKFLDIDSFENILINEKNLKIQSPLTLIFLKIFSPSEISGEKNFFQKNFTSGVNMNYFADYNENDLQKVPRFFNDLSYVNNLFNTYNFEELKNFLEEINQWKNIYTYEQEYTHPIKYFKQRKYITLRNNLTIYFISPYDLIIESHSKSTGIPFSDTVMAINQFIFHCDIKFDSKKGKFIFKTNVKILNSIKMLKNTVINNTIKEEGKNENDEEIINNVWFPMKKEILQQDLINQKNEEKIYKEYLKKNLNKYENNINEEYDNDSDDIWDSFSEKKNENECDNYNDNSNLNINMNDLNERNVKILKYGGIFLIGIYLIKIFFSSFSIDTIFGIFWISLIGYLFYKFR